MKNGVRAAVSVFLVVSATAHGRLTELTITTVEPFAPGASFGRRQSQQEHAT